MTDTATSPAAGFGVRAQLTLSALTMTLLFGLLGLAWWVWRYRSGYRPSPRKHRILAALGIAGLLFIAVGTAGRLAAALSRQPAQAAQRRGLG